MYVSGVIVQFVMTVRPSKSSAICLIIRTFPTACAGNATSSHKYSKNTFVIII